MEINEDLHSFDFCFPNLLSAFLQGDEMKKTGIQPIPMMDRDKKDEVPQGQVWTLSIKYIFILLIKHLWKKTFYMLVNIVFDVSVCGLLSSIFCMQNKVNFFK